MKRKIRRLKRKVHKLPTLHVIIAAFSLIILSFFSFIAYTVYSAPQYQAQVQHVKTKDADIAYYVRGKGEPIVLLSGFGMTMQHWDPLFLEKLSMGNQLIIIDHRGVGESSGNVKDLNSDIMAQDIITVMDALQIERAHVLGWSMGSFVGQVVAQKYPDRVDQLILIATAPGGEEAVPAPAPIRERVEKSLANTWEKAYAPMMFLDQKDTQEYLKRIEQAQAEREVPKGKGESFEMKVAHQLVFADQGREKARYLNLEKIKSPTLLISGEKDQLTLLENAKKVEAKIPNVEHHVIPDTGHAVMFEEIDETVKLIKAFLREK